ncbi:hypothetical protein NPX13_g8800 [Xylaria arbuscula]|uniref:Uncharacterized protein n=1 Tax=Xylaria arbuscula TaxID=114810 RepID=A0A9W8N7W8_9PEZI|nr:hypothetical protein NPX13_g8800 [Xylaria arbuscula]
MTLPRAAIYGDNQHLDIDVSSKGAGLSARGSTVDPDEQFPSQNKSLQEMQSSRGLTEEDEKLKAQDGREPGELS